MINNKKKKNPSAKCPAKVSYCQRLRTTHTQERETRQRYYHERIFENESGELFGISIIEKERENDN